MRPGLHHAKEDECPWKDVECRHRVQTGDDKQMPAGYVVLMCTSHFHAQMLAECEHVCMLAAPHCEHLRQGR